jgi:hypothetical protein
LEEFMSKSSSYVKEEELFTNPNLEEIGVTATIVEGGGNRLANAALNFSHQERSASRELPFYHREK